MNKKQQLVPLTDLNVTQEPHVTLHHNGRTDTPTSTSTINITLHVTHTSDGDIFNGHISNGFAGGHYNQNSYNVPPPAASPLRSTETVILATAIAGVATLLALALNVRR